MKNTRALIYGLLVRAESFIYASSFTSHISVRYKYNSYYR